MLISRLGFHPRWSPRVAAERFLAIREALEFQDTDALAEELSGSEVTIDGNPVPVRDALLLCKQALSGQDLEAEFRHLGHCEQDAHNVSAQAELELLWNDNLAFARCGARLKLKCLWKLEKSRWRIVSIVVEAVEMMRRLPPGSRRGRSVAHSSGVVLCAVATHRASGLSDLEQSCRQVGAELVVIGRGAPWFGFGYNKLRALYWFLRSHREECRIVLYTDGYDTVLAAGLDKILEQFRSLGSPIVFAAEANCYPGGAGQSEAEYPPAPTRYRFLNAGGIIAETEALLAMMERLGAPRIAARSCDQWWWAGQYVSGKAQIRLDHECRIFQCLHNATGDVRMAGREPRNLVTGSRPCILHGNGHTPLDPFSSQILGRRKFFQRPRKPRAARANPEAAS